MKECKHEFEWYGDDTSKCIICGLVVPDDLTSILDNDSNFYASAKEWLEEVLKERDELQAQVAVLRGALETVVEMGTYRNDGYASEDMLEEPWATVAANALAATPSESLERINKMVRALEFYAKWECDVLADEGEMAEKALAEWRK